MDMNTKNYLIVDGKYSPVIFEYGDSTEYITFRLAIDNIDNGYTFSLYDIGVSLNRSAAYYSMSTPFYNSNYTTDYILNPPLYSIVKDQYDITTTSLCMIDYLNVITFN
jgi:hypothetical protein